jgi:ADP-ribose pyrophosphatase YjhB (NUDIX family)
MRQSRQFSDRTLPFEQPWRGVVRQQSGVQRPGGQGDGYDLAATDGTLLLSQQASPSGELFQRPHGGHVEFGEHARATVRREFREEIEQELTDVRLPGVLENIFQWSATQREIVFIITATGTSHSRKTESHEVRSWLQQRL